MADFGSERVPGFIGIRNRYLNRLCRSGLASKSHLGVPYQAIARVAGFRRVIVKFRWESWVPPETIGCWVVTEICGRVGMTGEACHKVVIKKSN